MCKKEFSAEVGGKQFIITTGELAGQANASCTVQYGDTVVLATAVMSKEPREGIDYFPLLVDYEERLYAAGKIKGSRFIKREGRPSDEAILAARLVDRTIRPLFPKSLKNDVQVVLTVLSWDQENDPDILSLIAASTVLTISDIPWSGPVTGARIGLINNEVVLNPSYTARSKGDLDLVVAMHGDKVIMLESGAKETSEDEVLRCIQYAQKHVRPIINLIEDVKKSVGQEKRTIPIDDLSEEERTREDKLLKKVCDFAKDKIKNVFTETDREVQKQKLEQLKVEIEEELKNDNEVTKEDRGVGVSFIDNLVDKEVRRIVLEEGKRVDGRALDELRNISCKAGVLPRIHGSGLFNRGETQVLSIVTLGAPGAEQIIESMEEEYKKRYMHHYNFPGFSVGEVQPMRSPGRREIGHGALAEKAIIPVLPDKDKFPYTIRVVSEVLSSNGSTSQGAVCGSTLALMDAGVPLKAPVAGVAMGLMTDEDNPDKKYKILTDIQGIEDHSGDMDFKVSGTKNGITAIQMDTKIDGLTNDMIKKILSGARKARHKILENITKEIKEPRAELSPYAPRIITMRINPEKIREVIGPGGKVINEIIDKTGVAIDIEPDGTVLITGTDEQKSEEAVEWIKNLTREPEVGEIFEGRVTRLMDFGAFVEILPRQEGLVHISELSSKRVDKVADVVKVGDVVRVKVISIDDQDRINLSLKQASPDYDPKKDVRDKHSDRRRRPPQKRQFSR